MSGKYDLISQSISEIDDGKTEQSDTSSIPRRDCRAANEQENSGNRDWIQIRQFFPFDVDIVGEVVDITTNPTKHGKMNTIKSTKHTIANLQDPGYLQTKFPQKPNNRKRNSSKLHSPTPDNSTHDKTYRWFHLPANDMHWFEVDTFEKYTACSCGIECAD